MNLIIVESPSKTRTIEKYLGKDYKVLSSVGHIRDLPKSNKKAIDIEAGFVPHYEVTTGKEKVIAGLKKEAKKADEVLLATDPDREGEAIAWHVAEALGLDSSKTKRIVFNEITEGAVKEAMKNPREIDQNLKTAQEARRVLDRLVGYDLSGLIWKKVRYGLSAGRVQSPALRILMEREREIREFKPEDFWVISALANTKKKEDIPFTCKKEPNTQEETDRIIKVAKGNPWIVAEVKETESTRAPRPPFTTSTLQQVASTRLGYSPANTMRSAQKLYEAGHITYMRTDSTNMSKVALAQANKVIIEKFGKEYAESHVFKTKSKVAQEAHEAIRPTNLSKFSAGSSEDQKKLYKLIWARAIASQMSSAKIIRTKIVVDFKDAPSFVANGSRTIFDGWLAADTAAKGEDVELPEVKKKDELTLKNIESEAKQTQPPNRYTEAGLVKELEKRGIGRPSTYASIIKTIVDRGYVEKEGKTLFPTDTGDVVSTFLEKNFEKYISDSFTAEMEDELDEIASGKREYVKTLRDFYEPFSKQVKEKSTDDKITNLGDAPDEHKCPKCKKKMVIKLGKTGRFLSCSDFPDCLGARKMDGELIPEPKETGEACPKCKDGKLVLRHGRFGQFISCSNYPKCKFIKEDEETKKANSTGVVCTKCKKGEMTEKRGRFGPFFGCSNYPDCKHIIKTKPTGDHCKMCGELMMHGTKTIPDRCSDKSCPNHRPDKVK